MTQERINKLYEGLTNKELASVGFHYLTHINEREFRNVAESVARKTYECPDVEYQKWLNKFCDMAAFWAIAHWRAVAGKFASLAEMQILLAQNEIEQARSEMELHEKWDSRLLALDEALDAVGNTHGIQPASVRKIAGVAPYVANSEISPDVEYRKTIDKDLGRILGCQRAESSG